MQWFWGAVVSRDGLRLGCIGAPGYRAHSSVAMAPMFKGIRHCAHAHNERLQCFNYCNFWLLT